MSTQDTEYRGHIIEWIDHLGCYRVYKKQHPEQTCIYCDDIITAKDIIDERTIGVKVNERNGI